MISRADQATLSSIMEKIEGERPATTAPDYRTKPPPLYGEPVKNSTPYGSPWSIDLEDDYDGRYWRCHGETPDEAIAEAWDLVDAFAGPVVSSELRRLADESEAAASRVLVREIISSEIVVVCCLRDHAARLRARADELEGKPTAG